MKRNYLISTEMHYKLISMDIMESIEVIKLYNRNIKRSHSFLLNVFAQTQNSCSAPEKLKFRLLLSGTLSLSASYHLFFLSSDPFPQPCCPVENYALCLCQAFIATLLFYPMISALSIIVKQNSPSVNSSFR